MRAFKVIILSGKRQKENLLYPEIKKNKFSLDNSRHQQTNEEKRLEKVLVNLMLFNLIGNKANKQERDTSAKKDFGDCKDCR